MIGEYERAGRRRAAQDRALARYLRTHVKPYSPRYAPALAEQAIDTVHDLAKLPLTRLDDVDDPAALVLRPTAERITASGDRLLLARMTVARVSRRLSAFNRAHVEPMYKPVHWHVADGGVPVGYSAEDIDRLADIGRHALEMAGIGRDDVLVGLQPPVPDLGFWQVALGARSGGVSTLFLGDAATPDEVARLRPNVLAGRPDDLIRVLESGRGAGLSFAGLHTLLAVGEPLDPVVRGRLAELGGTATNPAGVVASWAPPGVRALWSECRAGVDVHTWPAVEVLELVDPSSGAPRPMGTDGEIVYTPLGWKGTVVLRLRTGIYACLDDTQCVSCGRTSPRLRLVPFLPPFARVLDDHPGVEQWQAELRTVDGTEELIVFVVPAVAGHPGRLLRELDRQLSVTQFVVLDRRHMKARLRQHGDARVVDMREGSTP